MFVFIGVFFFFYRVGCKVTKQKSSGQVSFMYNCCQSLDPGFSAEKKLAEERMLRALLSGSLYRTYTGPLTGDTGEKTRAY